MPTILRTGKHRLFFYDNERDAPPRAHVETGANYAKFWLNPVAVVKSVGYTVEELDELRALVRQQREFIEAKWHEFFGDT